MINSKFKAFAEAAELQNLTRVAEKLGYTQAGVSHLISALERELGMKLLTRAKYGVRLTKEGEMLLPAVQAQLAASEHVMETVAEIRGLSVGSVCVGTFSSAAISWVPRLLKEFNSRYPGIKTRVVNGTYSTIEQALLNNQVDCAFITLPSYEKFQEFPLAHDRLMVVVHQDHPFAKRSTIRPEELQDQPFIVPAEGANHDIGKLFERAGVSPQICFDIGDDYAAIAMVGQGIGITILPELLVANIPMSYICTIPLEHSERIIALALNQAAPASLAVLAFRDFVMENLGKIT